MRKEMRLILDNLIIKVIRGEFNTGDVDQAEQDIRKAVREEIIDYEAD